MRRSTGARVVVGLGAFALAASVSVVALSGASLGSLGGSLWVDLGPAAAGVVLIVLGVAMARRAGPHRPPGD